MSSSSERGWSRSSSTATSGSGPSVLSPCGWERGPTSGSSPENRKHNTTENHLYHPQHWCIHIRSEMYNNILKISTGYIYLCVLGRLIILKWIQISTDLLCLLKRCWRLFAAGPSPTYSEASQEDPCPIASSACRPSAPLTHLEEQNYIWYVLIQHQTCPNL